MCNTTKADILCRIPNIQLGKKRRKKNSLKFHEEVGVPFQEKRQNTGNETLPV